MIINQNKMYLKVLILFYFISITIGDASDIVTETKQLNSKVNMTKNTNSTITKQSSSNQTNLIQLSEGGGITININNSKPTTTKTTHMGREHTIEDNQNHQIDTSPSLPSELKYEAPEKNDNKTSVPKKGVTMPDNETIPNNISNSTISTTTTTTTTTMKPIKKKPTITEPGDELPHTPSNPNPKTPNNTYDGNDKKQKNRQADYIVPIVAVILSVPLVAIIISVLWKRGAEWWQHRHYRRMDFLIEGMYNN